LKAVNGELSEQCHGRLIQDGAHSGEFNMAADIYLSREAGRSGQIILRLYTWDRPTLSLGFHQKLADNLRESCSIRGVPIVRRPTGGRAVLHDQELTYCLAIPANHRLVLDGKDKLHARIGQAFVSAGERLGLQPRLARRGVEDLGSHTRFQSESPLCFDSVSRWEVRLKGRKWIGSAQRLFPYAYLQHGSILLGGTSESAREVNLVSPDLGAGFDSEIDQGALRTAVAHNLAQALDVSWQEQPFDDREIKAIQSALPDWISLEEDGIAS
jgi:lipoate-protein ligase A